MNIDLIKTIRLILITLLIVANAFRQVDIISDKDGYINVRVKSFLLVIA